MPTVRLFGYAARSPTDPVANPANLVNLYPEPAPEGSRTAHFLRSAVGLAEWADAGETWCASMYPLDDKLYAIFGGHLHQFDTGAVQTVIGTVARGSASMARNGDVLTIASAGQYYTVNAGVIATPAAGAFDTFGSVAFMAGRTILTELGGQRLQWSDVNDPDTLDGLNFGLADQRDDSLLRVVSASGALMLFGERSTEIWGVTGQAGPSAFALIPGAVRDTGLAGADLVTQAAGAVFLVANDGLAYIAAGTEWRAVSTPPVNRAIEDGTMRSCAYWEDGGHKFAAIVFADRPAWVYDMVTGVWHTRAEGRLEGPWRLATAVPWRGEWYFGAHDGAIYTAVRDGTDAGDVYYRRAISLPLARDGQWFGVSRLAVGASNGAQTVESRLMLEVSRDGVTWGPAVARSLGFDGDYLNRAEWRALGRAKQMTFRVSIADPCDFSLWSDAEVDLQ
jgi:hypothetical protein